MEIDNLPFTQAFQKLYLHRCKDPAWKLLETLCWKERTALQVRLNETKKQIADITAYSWLKNRLCLVRCAIFPCLGEGGDIDIWNMADADLIDNGRDDTAELEKILEDVQKSFEGYSFDFDNEPRDIYKERWYTVEDYGNYNGWIQCLFAEKFLEVHPQYTLPKHTFTEDEVGNYRSAIND